MALTKPLDYEELRRLAERDPDAFEKLRQELIDEAISRAPHHRRPQLRALQWRIDQARRRCRTPLAACLILSEMMWDSVIGKHGLLQAMSSAGMPPTKAAVLPFRLKPPD